MAIPILNHLDLRSVSELQNALLHKTTTGSATNAEAALIYDTSSNTLKFYNGSSWLELGTSSGTMSSFTLTGDSGSNQTIEDGNTLDVAGGDDISTVVGNTDTVTVNLNSALTTVASIFKSDLAIGYGSSHANIDFSTDNAIIFDIDGTQQIKLQDGALVPITDNDIDLGTSSLEFKNAYFDGTVTSDAFAGPLTGDVTGNADTATALATARAFTTTGDVVLASANFDGSGNFTTTATIQANAVEGSMLNNNVISGQTALTTGLASTDELFVSDAGTLKRMDVSVIEAYMQSNLTFTTNTDVDVSVANLKTRLAGGFGSNAVTIGDSDDTVTIGNDLVVTGDLTVSGDTITANVGTLDVEDKNITLNKSAGDSSGTADGAGITIQDAVDASTDASLTWNASGDKFVFSHKLDVTGIITATGTSVFTNLDISGDVDVDGTLETDALTIGGVTSVPFEAADHSKLDAISASATANSAASAAEVQTGTESAKFVTPDTLAAKSVHATIDVSDSDFASNLYAEITHSLGTEDVIVQCFDSSTKETIFADVARTDKSNSASTSKVKISFSAAPSNDIEVVITSIKGSTAGSVAYA